jgi:hypothetical protein
MKIYNILPTNGTKSLYPDGVDLCRVSAAAQQLVSSFDRFGSVMENRVSRKRNRATECTSATCQYDRKTSHPQSIELKKRTRRGH